MTIVHILYAIMNYTSQTSKCELGLVVFDFLTIAKMTNNVSLLGRVRVFFSLCHLKGSTPDSSSKVKKTEMIYNPLTGLL